MVARVELSPGAVPLQKRAGFLKPNQWVGMVAAGGGGYGDPKRRDRSLVSRDLREERISSTSAIEIYGLDPGEIPSEQR